MDRRQLCFSGGQSPRSSGEILATFPEIEPALTLVVTEMRTEMAQEVAIGIGQILEQVGARPWVDRLDAPYVANNNVTQVNATHSRKIGAPSFLVMFAGLHCITVACVIISFRKCPPLHTHSQQLQYTLFHCYGSSDLTA